jgi:hypothetical protein
MNTQVKKRLVMALVAILSFQAVALVGAQTNGGVISKVDAPDSAKPGETFTIDVTADVSLPVDTYIVIGLYDPSTWDVVFEVDGYTTGEDTVEATFDVMVFDEEYTMTLAADIYYQEDGEMTYTEGSEMIFTVEVAEGGGLGIPGFPLVSLMLGVAVTFALMNSRKTVKVI